MCERDLHACSRRFGRTLDEDGPAFPWNSQMPSGNFKRATGAGSQVI